MDFLGQLVKQYQSSIPQFQTKTTVAFIMSQYLISFQVRIVDWEVVGRLMGSR